MDLRHALRPEQRQRRNDAHFVFHTPEGGRLLTWMLKRFRVVGTGFDPDPIVNAFMAGERNAALELLELASITSGDIEELYREARLSQRPTEEGVAGYR